jgi:hypothetical protein
MTIVIDDGIHPYAYWCGADADYQWSNDAGKAIEFTHREDADLQIAAARDSVHDALRDAVVVL